jgi:hypothetical protein
MPKRLIQFPVRIQGFPATLRDEFHRNTVHLAPGAAIELDVLPAGRFGLAAVLTQSSLGCMTAMPNQPA